MKLNHMFLKIDYTTISIAWIGGTLMPFFLNIAPFIYISFLLVFVDLYTGVRAAKKRGIPITSKGFFRTVEKLLIYGSTIIVLQSITKVFEIPLPLSYMGALAIVITEMKSFAENMKYLTGVDILYKVNEVLKSIQNKSDKNGSL